MNCDCNAQNFNEVYPSTVWYGDGKFVSNVNFCKNVDVNGNVCVNGTLKAAPNIGRFEEEANLMASSVNSVVIQQSNAVYSMLRLDVPSENGLSISPNTEFLLGRIFDVDYPAFFSARGDAAVYVNGDSTVYSGTAYVNPNGFICVGFNVEVVANVNIIQATVTYPVPPSP
jgi:hypothetical protein